MVYKEMNIVPGVHISRNDRGESTAVMGNIAYPLSKISQPEKYFGELAGLLNCSLVLEFGIGELDFAASREELSYVPLTMNSIKAKLEALNAQLAVHLAQKANAITCEWARADYLREEARSVLFKEAVVKYVRDTKFALYDPAEYYGKKTFKYLVKDLVANKMEIRGMRVHGSSCSKTGFVREYDSTAHAYNDMVSIPCETDVVIVLNDLKTGIHARARYHFVNKEKPLKKHSIQVFCVSYDDPDMTVRQQHYDKLLKELHNPPIVIMASTLEKEIRAKNPATIGTQGLMILNKRAEYSRSRPDYVWKPARQEPDNTTTYYYVCLDNWISVYQDGSTPFDVIDLKSKLDQSGIPELNNLDVIGVRKNRIKDIKPLKNWIWIEDKVREEMNKITAAQVEAIVAAETLDNHKTNVYTSWDAVKVLGPSSLYSQYLNKYAKMKRNSDTSVPILVELCAKFGKTFVVDTIKQQILGEREALYTRYPMLKYLKYSDVESGDMVHYISLVDSQNP